MIVDGREQRLTKVGNRRQIDVAGDEQNWCRAVRGV